MSTWPSFDDDNAAPRASAREILAQGYRDRWRIIMAFLIPVLGAVAIALALPPTYEAVSSLLVRSGHEYVYLPQMGAGDVVALDEKGLLGSEVAIVTSRDLIRDTIDAVGLTRLFPDAAQAADPAKARDQAELALLEGIKAALGTETNVITIAFRHEDPYIAAETVNRLVGFYLDKRKALFMDDRTRLAMHQVDDIHQRLDAASRAVEEFKRSNNISSFGEQRTQLIDLQGRLQNDLLQAEAEMAEHSSRSTALGGVARTLSPVVELHRENLPDDAVAEAKRRVMELGLEVQDLSQRYRDDSRTVLNAREELAGAQAFLQQLQQGSSKTIRTGRNLVRQEVESDTARIDAALAAASARRDVIVGQLADVSGRLQRLNALEARLGDLEREQVSLEASYLKFTAAFDDEIARNEIATDGKSNVRVIQEALPPVKPRSVRRIIFAMGVMAGLAAAALAAFMSSLFRDDFTTPEAFERATGLPVIATIDLR